VHAHRKGPPARSVRARDFAFPCAAIFAALWVSACKSRTFQDVGATRSLDERGVSDCVRTEDDPVALLGDSSALDSLPEDSLVDRDEVLRFVAQICPPRFPELDNHPLMATGVSFVRGVRGGRDMVAVAYRSFAARSAGIPVLDRFKGALAVYEVTVSKARGRDVRAGRREGVEVEKERVTLSLLASRAFDGVAVLDVDAAKGEIYVVGSRLRASGPEAVIQGFSVDRARGMDGAPPGARLLQPLRSDWLALPGAQIATSLSVKNKRLFVGLADGTAAKTSPEKGIVALSRREFPKAEAGLPPFHASWADVAFPYEVSAVEGNVFGALVVVARRDPVTMTRGLTVFNNVGKDKDRRVDLDLPVEVTHMGLHFGRQVSAVAAGVGGVRFVCNKSATQVGSIAPTAGLAVSARGGAPAWASAAAVAIHDGTVYVATKDGQLLAYGLRGRGKGCRTWETHFLGAIAFNDAAARQDAAAFAVSDLRVRDNFVFLPMGYGGLRLLRIDELRKVARDARRDARRDAKGDAREAEREAEQEAEQEARREEDRAESAATFDPEALEDEDIDPFEGAVDEP
jgi:hypothetical protein